MNTTYALEPQIRFLLEERTEQYLEYSEGVPQRKIGHEAKNDWQRQALLGLERHGA